MLYRILSRLFLFELCGLIIVMLESGLILVDIVLFEGR